uniref:Transposable element Tc3 transposase n=1 Tax=Anoplophora glabripennis TaxID=217634 RepID=V5GPD3_ANOGL
MMIGYGDRIRTHEEVCVLFNEIHPNRPPINRSTVSRTEAKFRNHGHVKDMPRSGRPTVDEEVQLQALLTIHENPQSSLRVVADNLGMSESTLSRLLHRNKYHPYKVHLVQELCDDDFDRRTEFCEMMMEECQADPDFVKRIIFSDEASFYLNGTVNKQNCRYWSDRNPHWMMEAHTQHPQKVNVWAGIVGNRILGPYFFEGNLDGARYLEFLQFHLVPSLSVLFPNEEDPDLPNETIWFQQDGAPPHYASAVRRYLDDVFPHRWIGRRGPKEWPARSPDLTPLDFFLWGYVKSKIYVNKPNSINDLKERIRQEVRAIPPEVIGNVQQEFTSRLAHCLAVNGQQFEHLI